MTNKSIWNVDTMLNDAPAKPEQRTKIVECRLWNTYEKLAATEGNVKLFDACIKMNLATNDVFNFVNKQTIHKRARKGGFDFKVQRAAMTSKLKDALAYAKKLRQVRDKQKKKLSSKLCSNKSLERTTLKNLADRYKEIKEIEIRQAIEKVEHLKIKRNLVAAIKVAPDSTKEYLSNVNIFNEDQNQTKPEPPRGPFICDSRIKLSKDELNLLARGPKFMAREKIDAEAFEVNLEKMIVKKKYDRLFSDKDDLSNPECERNAAIPASFGSHARKVSDVLDKSRGIVSDIQPKPPPSPPKRRFG